MPNNNSTINTITVENARLLPQVTALINEGHTVTLPLKGFSMRPFLEDGRDKALLAAPENLKVNDVVLAEIKPGVYVLHRIIEMIEKQVTLRGDGNLGNEYCQIGDIRAKAIAFYRKGRTKADSVEGMKWKLYTAFWTRLYPLRRYLLFAMHPHIPQRLINKKKQ